MATMAAAWCVQLAIAFAMAAFFRVHCDQSTDSLGFISIDCGITEGSSYIDPITNITYVSDKQYTDGGINANISGAYVTNPVATRYLNVRSFPNGTRNCYTIKPITPALKYLVRATFLYGNYDGLGSTSLLFDLHLGVNLWKIINITDPAVPFRKEAIAVAGADFLSVCLVNTGQGTPFISGLDVRPLKQILYPAVNASRSLVLYRRLNMGPSDTYIRYPDDPHDRIWDPFINTPFWTEVSTNSTVQNLDDDKFEAPSAVMQTAVVPVNSTKLMMQWEPEPGDVNEFYAVMYFSELFVLTGNMSRQFWVYLNNALWYAKPFTPEYLYSDTIFGTNPTKGFNQYNVTVQALPNSTLPPILNAMEFFSRMSDDNLSSDAEDVDAMMTIRAWYKIKRNWMGDPCSPKDFVWDGVNCTSSLIDPARVTALNLSSSGLTGEITTSFASLNAIQFLDLSNNYLTGAIPAILSILPSLKLLDLTNNSLNGSVPSALLAKAQSGSLTLRIDNNPLLCDNATSCQVTATSSKRKVSTPVIVAVCIVLPLLLLLVVFILCRVRKTRGSGRGNIVKSQNGNLHKQGEDQNGPLHLENRQFTYVELNHITNNFSRAIGKGGFGVVYHGCLEDGTQVAVKMRSQSSSQGTKEFLAEAQHLARVHHKNLVSMVGYCNDGEHLALVYEYMAQGTLQDHLRGRAPNPNARPLSWGQRLQIAVEAAQGLEYLHRGCKPPLIHRDVKTANILLSQRLEAKIADFGLSKPFQSDVNTHVSTAVVGTPGYLDPEYYTSFQLSEKSDVFSFGVVLLELITGQPPVISAAGNAHIAQWVRQRLGRGNIEEVVDARLQGEYDVNSVWKCAEVALKCAAHSSHQRPAMAEVVVELKESLELESPAAPVRLSGNLETASEKLYSEASDASRNSELEIERVARMSVVTGPSAR